MILLRLIICYNGHINLFILGLVTLVLRVFPYKEIFGMFRFMIGSVLLYKPLDTCTEPFDVQAANSRTTHPPTLYI